MKTKSLNTVIGLKFSGLVRKAAEINRPLLFSKSDFTLKVYWALWGKTCIYCDGPLHINNFSPDHVVPLYHGGTQELSNIAIVCKVCNAEKSHYSLDYFISTDPIGRRLNGVGDPGSNPVRPAIHPSYPLELRCVAGIIHVDKV